MKSTYFAFFAYRDFTSGLVNGNQRLANLDTFLECARIASKDSPYLSNFLEFLNHCDE